MARSTSVSLGDHFSGLVEQQLASGRYGSASEVVRAGPRPLEEHEALRAALIEGERSVASQPLDFDRFPADRRARRRG